MYPRVDKVVQLCQRYNGIQFFYNIVNRERPAKLKYTT